MKIFEYAVILHPTEQQKKEGARSEILVDVQRVLACDLNQALILASRAIPENHVDKLDRLEVAVRPF